MLVLLPVLLLLLLAFELQSLIPFHQFVDEAEVGLDDDVQTAGADETAVVREGGLAKER